MIMRFNQLLDMPHLSVGFLGEGEMLPNRDVNNFERNKLFVLTEHFWDLIFQFMQPFLFSIT